MFWIKKKKIDTNLLLAPCAILIVGNTGWYTNTGGPKKCSSFERFPAYVKIKLNTGCCDNNADEPS